MCPYCAFNFGQAGGFGPAHLICHCLLIETDQGLVLVDTGFGTQDLQTPRLGRLLNTLTHLVSGLAATAKRQIIDLGFKVEDVRHIFVTHLDYDHAGGISDFPHATVYVLTEEYQAAHTPRDIKSRIRYRPVQFKDHQYWHLAKQGGESWMNFQQVQSLPLFKDEIAMIPLLGHSHGHTGIAVQHQGTWRLHCGDAYYHQAQITDNHTPLGLKTTEKMLAVNNPQRLANLAKLQTLHHQHPSIQLICAHDPQGFPSG